MIESSLARRYAKALLALGEESSQTAVYLQYLEDFGQMVRQHPELIEVLANRFMDLKARLRVIDELASKTGAPQNVTNFLKLLASKGRIELLLQVIDTFRQYVYGIQNKVTAKVFSAKELSEVEYEKITKAFTKVTGKTVVLEKQVKPDVLGGLAIQIGGEIFDGTVRSRLTKMAQGMKKAAVL